VPAMVRWPGNIPAGAVSNEIIAHQDWLPTLLAAAGDPDVSDRLKEGYQIGDRRFKVRIDGYDFLPYLTGKEEKGPRPGFIYFSDDGDLVALRYDNWKVVFAEQRMQGTVAIWAEPFTFLRVPKIFNLRTDPFERADITSNTYWDWMIDHAYITYAAQFLIRQFLDTFQEFPPRMKPASFGIDQILAKMEQALNID
jgi:arylsulfatase A-like enzyme